jgi:hypothetical protein
MIPDIAAPAEDETHGFRASTLRHTDRSVVVQRTYTNNAPFSRRRRE